MFDIGSLPAGVGALIFDCDGTLVDTPPAYARAWATGFRSAGAEMAPDWYLARAGMSEYVLMDAFEAEQGVTLRRDEVVRRMREAFLEGLAGLREIEAITAIARQHRGRLPMAVASGGPATTSRARTSHPSWSGPAPGSVLTWMIIAAPSGLRAAWAGRRVVPGPSLDRRVRRGACLGRSSSGAAMPSRIAGRGARPPRRGV